MASPTRSEDCAEQMVQLARRPGVLRAAQHRALGGRVFPRDPAGVVLRRRHF